MKIYKLQRFSMRFQNVVIEFEAGAANDNVIYVILNLDPHRIHPYFIIGRSIKSSIDNLKSTICWYKIKSKIIEYAIINTTNPYYSEVKESEFWETVDDKILSSSL